MGAFVSNCCRELNINAVGDSAPDVREVWLDRTIPRQLDACSVACLDILAGMMSGRLSTRHGPRRVKLDVRPLPASSVPEVSTLDSNGAAHTGPRNRPRRQGAARGPFAWMGLSSPPFEWKRNDGRC